MRNHTRRSLEAARRLRSEMTLPELLVWRELRKWPDGLKFRRQHPVGSFVVDFYCHEARLAVEVDGSAHDMGDGPERDARRDAWLRDEGIRILRIAARDVLADLAAAITMIVAEASPLRRAARATSPDGGGVWLEHAIREPS